MKATTDWGQRRRPSNSTTSVGRWPIVPIRAVGHFARRRHDPDLDTVIQYVLCRVRPHGRQHPKCDADVVWRDV
jgi:hypothetical protein